MRLELPAFFQWLDDFAFQFHKGAIRTRVASCLDCYARPHFNSIKVRLEHMIDFNAAILPRFQFHKGAIRTEGVFH